MPAGEIGMMKKKKVTGIIQTYSRKAREQIMLVGLDFLKEVGLERYVDDIFSCVDELIKNAVKANYKFALIVEKMAERIRAEEPGLSEPQVRQKINAILCQEIIAIPIRNAGNQVFAFHH